MSIYDINKTIIPNAFDLGGGLSFAYDIYGNRVDDAEISRDLFWNHGKLKKNGKYLVDEYNHQIEIRGVGTHHLLQYSNLHTLRCLTSLRNFGVNCLRVCVYLEDYTFAASFDQLAYGYLSHPQETKEAIESIVDICTSLGMYVLLDWHVYAHGAAQQGITGTAMLHQIEAEEFFEYFSEKYKDSKNLMYEIANEPYLTLTAAQCLPFVQSIRSIIRSNDPDAVIVMNRASDGLPSMYNVLRNAGITDVFVSHHQYGENIASTYNEWWTTNNYPLFNTEWGNSGVSGDGYGNPEYARAVLEFYHLNAVPHAVWKFTDQTMTTSLLKNIGFMNNVKYANGFNDSDLSANGILVLKEHFLPYATTDHIDRSELLQ